MGFPCRRGLPRTWPPTSIQPTHLDGEYGVSTTRRLQEAGVSNTLDEQIIFDVDLGSGWVVVDGVSQLCDNKILAHTSISEVVRSTVLRTYIRMAWNPIETIADRWPIFSTNARGCPDQDLRSRLAMPVMKLQMDPSQAIFWQYLKH